MKYILFIILFITSAYAQNLHQRFDGIPFNINGLTPVSPFNGGIDIPRYQFADIDNDNDLDLFIFDKDTSLNFYKNEGNATAPLFRLNSVKYHNLSIKNWFFLADADNDNDLDLFCGGDSQHVRYFKNNGTPQNPVYTIQTYGIKTNLNNFMESESASVPVFADMDGDGDLDFFTGSSSGKITYYQNTGTAQNFVFTYITDFYKNIEIIGGADINRHGASAITFADIDGDNDKDLYWGDLFGLSIYFIKNTGTPQNFTWNFIDTTSPKPNAYYSGGFNMPGIYDINGDGNNDFFIGVLIGSKTIDNFVFYRNNGPVNNPSFAKVTDNFILSADMGSYSYPTLADIDNDGDKDLFIGCDNSVAFFRNNGTQSSPSFILVNDSLPLNVSNFNFAPAIGDLDGDLKKDLVLGYFAGGKLRFFKNTGTPVNPVFTYQSSQLDTMNLAQSSAPVLADLDNDNDLDLLVGSSGGRLTYYRNNGGSGMFNFQFVTNNFEGIFTGNDAAPSLGDLDGDGDLDLLVGNKTGKIFFYRNTGSVTNPSFTLVTNNYAGINVFMNAVPCITDINNDSDIDLLVGNTKGGLYFYENWDVFGIQQISNEIPEGYKLYQNYPNPFNPVTKIRFDVWAGGKSLSNIVSLRVYDALGKEIIKLVNRPLIAGTFEANWDASSYPSGVYFYQLSAGDFKHVRKMVLVK